MNIKAAEFYSDSTGNVVYVTTIQEHYCKYDTLDNDGTVKGEPLVIFYTEWDRYGCIPWSRASKSVSEFAKKYSHEKHYGVDWS